MRSTLLVSLGLCSAWAHAQLSVDQALGGSAVSQIQAYGSSLVANPVWTNNIATLQSNVPPSVVSLFSPDPRYLIESLATASTTPDYLSSVPSGVISTFTSLASGPAKAAIDIKSYVDSLYMNGNQKVFSELATDLPQDVLSDAAADPLGFLAGLVVQSGSAPWVTAIPNSLQSQVASGVNHMLAIISSDIAAPTGSDSSSIMPGSGTGGSVSSTATSSATGSGEASSSSPAEASANGLDMLLLRTMGLGAAVWAGFVLTICLL